MNRQQTLIIQGETKPNFVEETQSENEPKSPNPEFKSNQIHTNLSEVFSPKVREQDEESEKIIEQHEDEEYESSNQEECSDDDIRLQQMALIRQNRQHVKKKVFGNRLMDAKMRLILHQQNKRHQN